MDRIDSDAIAVYASGSETELDEYEFINDVMGISGLLDAIGGLPSEPPSLYMAFEFLGPAEHEKMVILEIHVRPTGHTYLIDVNELEDLAFTTPGIRTPLTLISILEKSTIPKVFFDVAYSAHVLCRDWDITLGGAYDLQLVEIPRPLSSDSDPIELRKSFETEKPMTTDQRRDWIKAQERAVQNIKHCRHRNRQVFRDMLTSEVKGYCVQNVKFVRRLWLIFDRRFEPQWKETVRADTATRLLVIRATSCGPCFLPYSPSETRF
ncbi:hypothetical protein E0Z10_g5989 [Xylaria hypoxylon]|uniref:3'-5' exonuclease domain-containing protein n=1 Tax=Xylaria hypoxylon TaxID=37992 RepID=A0A4Z0YZM3_9PEZI|nr:hypothetical protein E0Z10_g5989 [Xylaria hypoxylon]